MDVYVASLEAADDAGVVLNPTFGTVLGLVNLALLLAVIYLTVMGVDLGNGGSGLLAAIERAVEQSAETLHLTEMHLTGTHVKVVCHSKYLEDVIRLVVFIQEEPLINDTSVQYLRTSRNGSMYFSIIASFDTLKWVGKELRLGGFVRFQDTGGTGCKLKCVDFNKRSC
jgi:hypothetical protein